MPTKKLTPIAILKRIGQRDSSLSDLHLAPMEMLLARFQIANDMETTETIKAYADWLRHRPNFNCTHLDLCRLWFVCEMGYCADGEQEELEAEFLK